MINQIEVKPMTEEELKKWFNPAPNIYLGHQGHYWCSKCGECVGFPVYGRVGYFRWNKDATAVETYQHKCKKH